MKRIQATDRNTRKMEKSSDKAHTQGLSQHNCQSDAHTVRLKAQKAINRTMDRSARRVNW